MIEYPDMRESVVDALETLANPDYQRRMWVDERGRHPDIIENLDQNVHVLYDDTDVAESPHQHVGVTLRNEREAEAIEALDRVLSPLLDSLPADIDDATVIAKPEWQDVVAAAKAALRVFAEPESPDVTS